MLNVAIIGCGLIGAKRARSIARLHSNGGGVCRLVSFCDVNRKRAETCVSQYGGTFSPEWEEVVRNQEVDVVVVATVNKFIAPIAIEALKNGKHVLCEKPLGRNVEEAGAIVAAAKSSGAVLKTGFNHRHHPGILRAKAVVDRQELGKLYLLRCCYGHGGRPGYDREWRADKDLCGGGELLDQGVHVVDLFRWFMGDFEEAFGYTPTYFWDMAVEDNGLALFRTKNEQVAFMHTSWTQWKNLFTFEVYGELGYLVVEGLGGSYGPERLTVGKRPRSKDRFVGGVPAQKVFTFDEPDHSWDAEWLEFVWAIRKGQEPLGNGTDGLEANRMIEAVYASARHNRPVRIQGGNG